LGSTRTIEVLGKVLELGEDQGLALGVGQGDAAVVREIGGGLGHELGELALGLLTADQGVHHLLSALTGHLGLDHVHDLVLRAQSPS
jgi:hypothetical protein